IVKAAPALQDWRPANLMRLFDRDIWSFLCQYINPDELTLSQYYRLISGLFVMINYLFAALDPLKWHLTAIFLHAIASIVAYRLILDSLRAAEVRESHWLALVSTVCFAI